MEVAHAIHQCLLEGAVVQLVQVGRQVLFCAVQEPVGAWRSPALPPHNPERFLGSRLQEGHSQLETRIQDTQMPAPDALSATDGGDGISLLCLHLPTCPWGVI